MARIAGSPAPMDRAGAGAGTLTFVHMGLLGAVLTLADRPLFTRHLVSSYSWGLSPLQDQQLGGSLMWVPGIGLFDVDRSALLKPIVEVARASTAGMSYVASELSDESGLRAREVVPLTWFVLLVSITVCLVISALLWAAIRGSRSGPIDRDSCGTDRERQQRHALDQHRPPGLGGAACRGIRLDPAHALGDRWTPSAPRARVGRHRQAMVVAGRVLRANAERRLPDRQRNPHPGRRAGLGAASRRDVIQASGFRSSRGKPTRSPARPIRAG